MSKLSFYLIPIPVPYDKAASGHNMSKLSFYIIPVPYEKAVSGHNMSKLSFYIIGTNTV